MPYLPVDKQDDLKALKAHTRAIKTTYAANKALDRGDSGRAAAIYNAGAKHRGEDYKRDRRHANAGLDLREKREIKPRKPINLKKLGKGIAATAVTIALAPTAANSLGKIGTNQEPAAVAVQNHLRETGTQPLYDEWRQRNDDSKEARALSGELQVSAGILTIPSGTEIYSSPKGEGVIALHVLEGTSLEVANPITVTGDNGEISYAFTINGSVGAEGTEEYQPMLDAEGNPEWAVYWLRDAEFGQFTPGGEVAGNISFDPAFGFQETIQGDKGGPVAQGYFLEG